MKLAPRLQLLVVSLFVIGCATARPVAARDIPWRTSWDEQNPREILEIFELSDQADVQLRVGLPSSFITDYSGATGELIDAFAGAWNGGLGATWYRIAGHGQLHVTVAANVPGARDSFGRSFLMYYDNFDPVPRLVTADEIAFTHGEAGGAVLTADGRVRQITMLRGNIVIDAYLVRDRLLDDLDEPDPIEPTLQWWFDFLGAIDKALLDSPTYKGAIPDSERPALTTLNKPDELVFTSPDQILNFDFGVRADAPEGRTIVSFGYGDGWVGGKVFDVVNDKTSEWPSLGFRVPFGCAPDRETGKRPTSFTVTVSACDDRGMVTSIDVTVPLRYDFEDGDGGGQDGD